MIIYTIIVSTNSVYSLASLFLPTVFKEKSIPGFWVGLVFSMYSIAVVIVSPFVGTLLNKVGFANLIAIGLVLMGIAIVPVGFLMKIEDDVATLVLGILLRGLQGAASALINTSCYATAANKYPERTEFIVGMLEGMSGIGVIIGLFGGAAIYEGMGYQAVFIVFGGLLPVMAFMSRVLFRCTEQGRADDEYQGA